MKRPSLRERLRSSTATIFKAPKQPDVVSTTKAQERFSHFTRAFNMNPKGFRQSSKKFGPPRAITAPDRLVIAIIGSAAIPSRTQSPRKKLKAEAYDRYIQAVKDSPSQARRPGR